MGVIFVASSQPELPYQDQTPDWLPHGLGYLVLALLASRALGPGVAVGRPAAAAVFAFCLAYGVSDEWHQSFVPGRQADPWDVVKDGVGALGGLALYHAWSRRVAPGGVSPS
jgi:VanZ family protein